MTSLQAKIQYCPYDINASAELLKNLLVVDCTHPEAITLTHHKGGNNPQGIEPSDSSTGWALNAIKAKNQFVRDNVKFVTSSHYDIDAVLSMWVILNPEIAIKWDSVLRHAARIGDFREVALRFQDFEQVPEFKQDAIVSADQALVALKLCCWLNSVEKRLFSVPYESEDDRDQKFEYFLSRIATFLEAPDDFKDDWQHEYDEVIQGWEEIAAQMECVRKMEDISLAVIFVPRRVHYYSLFSFSLGCDYLLTIYPGNKYELENKYTQTVNLYSRPTLPRLNLVPLAKFLNKLESQYNQQQKETKLLWDVSRFVDSGPLLRLDDQGKMLSKQERYGHPFDRQIFSSSIGNDEIIHIVTSYLRFGSFGFKGKVGGWSWQELQSINSAIKWDEWVV